MKYSRIIFSLLMCCIILLSEAISVTADIDSDGQITLMDATLIQLWLAQLPSNDMIGKRIGPPPMPTQDEYEMPII